MSADDQTESPSRPTNETNSVNGSDAGISDSRESRDIPTPAEKVAEFYDEYPDRAQLLLTDRDGTKLRKDYTHERRNSWEYEPATVPCGSCGGTGIEDTEEESCEACHGSGEIVPDWDDSVTGNRTVSRDPVRWGEAVKRLVEQHEDTRRTTLNLERGRPGDVEYAEFSIDVVNRWFACYQQKYFAQMKGWFREITGGDRPSGGITDASFDNPNVALITRSASAIPDGKHVPPVDHANELSDSWSDVYDTLRNTMRSLGFEIGDWQYDRRLEPHHGDRGGGANHCYTHEHVIVIVDGDVSERDFAPVLDKHVEACEWAGVDAHQVGDAVEVRDPEDLEDVAAYVADYCGIEPVDLLERGPEYIAWSATMTAANTRTVSRSDAARHAATADACKQRYENPRTDQDEDHGESVIRARDNARHDVECSHCGSPHGINQETVVRARLDSGNNGHQAVCDGGRDFDQERHDRLDELWQDARAAASIGETPTRARRRKRIRRYLRENPSASDTQVLGALELPPGQCRDLLQEVRSGYERDHAVGFERPPQWRVKSVEVGKEEYPASSGGGVDMVEISRSGWFGNLPESVEKIDDFGGFEVVEVGTDEDGDPIKETRILRDGSTTVYRCTCCGYTSPDPRRTQYRFDGHKGGNESCSAAK